MVVLFKSFSLFWVGYFSVVEFICQSNQRANKIRKRLLFFHRLKSRHNIKQLFINRNLPQMMVFVIEFR